MAAPDGRFAAGPGALNGKSRANPPGGARRRARGIGRFRYGQFCRESDHLITWTDPVSLGPMLIAIPERPEGPRLALAYAGPDNFTGRRIYARAALFLHPDAASGLERAQALARAIGLTLVVFDGFRPAEAQWLLWRTLPDETYVAHPLKGSRHSRGIAVDLTLARPDGGLLDMGTGFDDMTAASHHGAPVGQEAMANRMLLAGLMAEAGFGLLASEWWHYELPDAGRYPLLTDAAAGTRLLG